MALRPYSPSLHNTIKSWKKLVDAESGFDSDSEWAFRGQNTPQFPASSLERHCKNLKITGADIEDLEVKLIRDFARRYHLYAGYNPPPKGNTLEWLSLLRHYGTPTRLVDFTYSFFIATYFALENADKSAVVWAVNVTRYGKEVGTHISAKLSEGKRLLDDYYSERDGAPFRKLFMEQSGFRFVLPVNPIRLSDRLTIQQGVFLAPGDVTTTFKKNFQAVPDYSRCIKKFIVDPNCWQESLRKLHRMGINRATLFPGLEGFAQSLRTKSLILKDLPVQSVEKLKEV